MQRWQTFSLFALRFFQFCYHYLKIWHLLFVPHHTYTNHEGDSLFLLFCTIGSSMDQISTLPYIIPYLFTSSLFSFGALKTDGQRKLFTPCSLSSFFSLNARGPTHRRNSTRLAELRGGWPIELGGVNLVFLLVSPKVITTFPMLPDPIPFWESESLSLL